MTLAAPASTGRLTPDDIVGSVKHLPSAPKVLPRLKQLLSDGNSAIHEIVALIRYDYGILARVLQVANSAYFSHGVRCFTIEEAVIRVGYNQIYELVSYAVASQVLVRPLTTYGIDADDLWRMSVAGAIAAETLAEHGRQDRELAYTIGLLHCVGMVAIDEWALRHSRDLRISSQGFPREAIAGERAALGFTQAEVGSTLLCEWGFPPAMTEPVRWQYAPQSCGGYVRMTSLLFAAKWLRTAVLCRHPEAWPQMPDAACLQTLALNPYGLRALAAKVAGRLAEVSSLLEIDVTDADANRRARFPSPH